MQVGVFAVPGDSPDCVSFAAGLDACGVAYKWRNPNAWADDCFEAQFDCVVVPTLRGLGQAIVRRYLAEARQAVVIDLGFLRRMRCRADFDRTPDNFFQVSVGGLNWLPPGPCPTDRLDALNLTFCPFTDRGPRAPVVVCGQLPGDAAHGMDDKRIEAWAAGRIKTLRRHTTRPILWRPHPFSCDLRVDADGISRSPVADMLAEAHAVVTYRSNLGHDALIAGCPVFCDPGAVYAPLGAGSLARAETPGKPDAARVRAYMARLAYGQWTRAEMAAGAAWRFLEGRICNLVQV